MHSLYLFSVWLHLLAAAAWVGAMVFLAAVVVPWMRAGHRAEGSALLRDTGARLRALGWICLFTLAVTGVFNAWMRGARLSAVLDPAWRHGDFALLLLLKVALFALIVVLSAVHDFFIGPRAVAAMEQAPAAPDTERFRRQASLFGRTNGVLALSAFAVAVMLVRGCPG